MKRSGEYLLTQSGDHFRGLTLKKGDGYEACAAAVQFDEQGPIME